MDLGEWLRSLGLGQYEATFRESEIDADILLELTDQDLEKLGVPLGHRKRLLKAIGTLKDHAAGAVSASRRPSTDTAERRQVTVMFSDLGQRFHGSNHIRQPRRACRTRCGGRDGD